MSVILGCLLKSENGTISCVATPRDDYRECGENALIILGPTPLRGIHFLKPGAVHQARWISSNIYAGKMFMFSRAMRNDDGFIMKLKRMNTFLPLLYTPA
jgi:hypothetical protein